jgi:hypothetical protein
MTLRASLTPLEVYPAVKELLQPRFDLYSQIGTMIEVHQVAHDTLDLVPTGAVADVSVICLATA